MDYRILDLVRGTTVDGPGFRTSIYFSGCRHKCQGCHNPQSWDFSSGEDMSLEALLDIIREEDFDVTLSGGDPLYQGRKLIPLLEGIRSLGHSIWIYTGFSWEEIAENPAMADILRDVEVVVDGPFIESLRDPDLLFRGSSNQRLISVEETLKSGKIHLWDNQDN